MRYSLARAAVALGAVTLFAWGGCGGGNHDRSDGGASDGAVDASSLPDVATSDAASDALPSTYCTLLDSGAASFCADFDENDVALAFVNGAVGTWTTISNPPPTLDFDASASPPASARFDATQTIEQGLAWSIPGKPATITVHAQVRMEPTSSSLGSPTPIVILTTSATTALSLVLQAGVVNGFSVTLNEMSTNADGGVTTTPHVFGTFTADAWVGFTLVATSTTASCTATSINAPLNLTRATNAPMSGASIAFDIHTWSGELDDVVIAAE